MTDTDRKVLGRSWIWDHEIDDRSVAGRRHLIARLTRICKSERERGLAGSWNYQHMRHQSLLRILDRERKALDEILARSASAETGL